MAGAAAVAARPLGRVGGHDGPAWLFARLAARPGAGRSRSAGAFRASSRSPGPLARWPDHLAAGPTWTTLAVGVAATSVAIALVAGCLENESRRQQRPGAGALALLYVPLLVPQIGFLFGVQVLFLWLGLADGWLAVIWTHLLFVLPYVFLTLADPYRSLDPRYARTAPRARQAPVAGLAEDQAGDAAPPSDRHGGGVRGQRGAVPADPVRRRRPLGHARHRDLEPGRRRRSSDHRRVRLRARDAVRRLRAGSAATAWRFRHRRAMWVGN